MLCLRFREIGTVSGWEKLQIHAKEDINGREGEREREEEARLQLARASLRSDFDSISDTRYLGDVFFDSRRVEEGRAIFPTRIGVTRLVISQNICKIMIN